MQPGFSRRRFLQSLGAAGAAGSILGSPTSAPAAAYDSRSAPLISSSMAGSSSGFVHPQKVLLWERTRKEVREALQSGDLKAAIVPTGSTEQHNEHLALITDAATATLFAQQAALRLYPRATVSTPCPVGYSPYHMARKGTLTLRKETFLAYVFDVIESLTAHGFGTILVVNGHGGNHGLLKGAVPEWRRKLGVTLDAVSYGEGYKEEELATFLTSYRQKLDGELDTLARQTGHSHASENETSIVMAAYPDRVRFVTLEEYDRAGLNYESDMPPKVWEYMEPFDAQRTTNPENPRDRARQEQALLATPEKGERLIALGTRYIVDRLQQMIQATDAGRPWP